MAIDAITPRMQTTTISSMSVNPVRWMRFTA
jgi:hypothetical protein